MSEQAAPNDLIRTEPRPQCYLCGSAGEILYAGMRDRLFGVPGEWSLRKCDNADCGLVWSDPCTITEDIPKLYRTYYTHRSDNALPLRVYRWLCDGVLSATLGYRSRGWWNRMVGKLLSHSGLLRDAFQASALWLPAGTGKLLDVGCGNGDFLARMKGHGWDVQGIEPDPAGAAVARERGLVVTAGILAEGTFQPASFDVVTMSHVLEHLPDPIQTLRACRQLLRPGGKLVALTPNVESLGTQVFGRHWLGYDAPRHLLLASPSSLRRMAVAAGFPTVHVRTSGRLAWVTWRISEPLMTTATLRGFQLPLPYSRIPIGVAYHLREHAANLLSPVGEELVLVARTSEDPS